MADQQEISHGSKRSDKETQSPVLKVFNQMMQRSENPNSEKANLLEEKREKKRKRYAVTRCKSDKSGDTSTSERLFKVVQHQQHSNTYSQEKSQTVLQGEHKDSWWNCNVSEKKEDTCSCVSCALKKIFTRQRHGMLLCLAAFFSIAGIVAVYLIYQSMCHQGYVDTSNGSIDLTTTEYEDLKDLGQVKLGALGVGEKRGRRGSGDDKKMMEDGQPWDESRSKLFSGLSDLYNPDLSESSLHEGNVVGGSAKSSFADLSSILDPNKLNEGYYSSNSLRNFYKKLIKTDMQIKNLERNIQEIKRNDLPELSIPRPKRSLKFVARPKREYEANVNDFKDLNIYFPPANSFTTTASPEESVKVKREANNTNRPVGFVIENKSLIVEYSRDTEEPKHTTTKSHKFRIRSHKNELKAKSPPRKHSERLDEYLGRLIDKNEGDPTTLNNENARVAVNEKKKEKHPNDSRSSRIKTKPRLQDDTESKSSVLHKSLRFSESKWTPYPLAPMKIKQSKTVAESKMGRFRPINLKSEEPEIRINQESSTTQEYEGILSISTITNPLANKVNLMQRIPNLRKLQQADVDDEESDRDDEEDDDEDDEEKRKKRTTPNFDDQPVEKYHPPSLYNPNWKGPLPLYPDELNAMIKQAANSVSKSEIPVIKDNAANNARDVSDTEYVEDYANSKYDKLVKMAQAYSDYGVLEGKKETRNEKNGKALEKRVKLSVQKGLGMFERLKKSHSEATPSEGIRFEYKPKGTVQQEKFSGNFFKFTNHWKLAHNQEAEPQTSTMMPMMHDFLYTHPENMKESLDFPKINNLPSDDGKAPLHFRQRSLKSVDSEDESDLSDVQEENDNETFTNETNKRNENETVTLEVSWQTEDSVNKSDVLYDKDVNMSVYLVKRSTDNAVAHSGVGKFWNWITDKMNAAFVTMGVGKDSIWNPFSTYWDESVQVLTTPNPISVEVSDNVKENVDNFPEENFSNATEENLSNATETYFNASSLLEDSTETTDAVEASETEEYSDEAQKDDSDHKRSYRSIKAVDEEEYENSKEKIFNDKSKNDPTTTSAVHTEALKANDTPTGFQVDKFELMDSVKPKVIRSADEGEKRERTFLHRLRELVGLNPDGTPLNKEDEFIYLTPLAVPRMLLEADKKRPENQDRDGMVAYITRRFLSVDDNDTVAEDDKVVEELTETTDKREFNATTVEVNKVDNASNLQDTTIGFTNIENKTVVKRSADDNSHLIFWNDMYDDEYGVKDPMENAVRDKHFAKYNDMMSKSQNWFGGKLRRIAHSMRKPKTGKGKTTKLPANEPARTKTKKIIKRSAPVESKNQEAQSFVALTANMKKVCQEAAKAVKETKDMKGGGGPDPASDLMMQLFALMSDLVNIQVQQKACVPLPPDLHTFLVWLTNPNPEENPSTQTLIEISDTNSDDTAFPAEKARGHSPDPMFQSDVRTECLGTIHDVQDLITQYDEMSEEDKSKMSGVREYLENQLDFLHRQLSTFEGYSSPAYHGPFVRRRRHPASRKRNRRMKRKVYKFIKNFGRKHTTTSSYDSLETLTEANKHKEKSDNRNDVAKDGYDKIKASDKMNGLNDVFNVKRNLPDVYYRALAVAKNTTTAKDLNSFSESSRAG